MNKFNLYLLVVILILTVAKAMPSIDEVPQYFGESTGKCLTQSGASLDGLESCKEGKLPEDENFKCFVTCLVQEHGLLDKDGNLKILDIPVPSLKESMEFCNTLGGSNMCDKGYQIAKCLLDKLHIYDTICTLVLS